MQGYVFTSHFLHTTHFPSALFTFFDGVDPTQLVITIVEE